MHHFGLLIDTTTQITVSRVTACMATASPTLLQMSAICHSALMKQYPDVVRSVFHDQPIKQNVTYSIKTSSPPVSARPRRLKPDRLKAVKREFQHMLGRTTESSARPAAIGPPLYTAFPTSHRLIGEFAAITVR